MFRNAPQGGSTGISMSVGPSPINGAQNAFPIDVVPYGGLLVVYGGFADGLYHELLAAPPAGYLWRLQRLTMYAPAVGLLTGTDLNNYGLTSTANPVDNLLGQLCGVQLNFASPTNAGTQYQVNLFYDQVLIPSIT